MSKNSKAGQRACRQQKPTKIVVERHYVGTEKMETVFKRIAEEQITKKVKDRAQSNASEGGKWKREYSIIRVEEVPFH